MVALHNHSTQDIVVENEERVGANGPCSVSCMPFMKK